MSSFVSVFARGAVLASLALAMLAAPARCEALLLVDAGSGKVLHAENAGHAWYPASITKLMTAYVTLRAVKEGRLKLDTLLTVSETALAQQPSKMGFPVGTQVTVDNALKMLMVKSANDMAVVLAEGVSGSIEKFADEMNQASARLGMVQSSWVNPNGLPAEGQITSARDMAILARTLIREFPEYELYWRISAIKFGRRIMRNYNKLIDRYPGADGMKTGFICSSGYNLVASATRNGKRLIAVVLGASSGTKRAETAAGLLERGFASSGSLSWLMPAFGTVDALQPVAGQPPDLREQICGKHRGRVRTDHAAEEEEGPAPAGVDSGASAYAALMADFRPDDKTSLLGPLTPSMAPIPVTVIPPKGAPADPDAMALRQGKKAPRFTRSAGGRQSAVIAVENPEKVKAVAAAGDKLKTAKKEAKKQAKKEARQPAAAKPKPAAAPQPKPAAAAAAPKPKAAAAAAPKPKAAAPKKPPAAGKPPARKPAASAAAPAAQ